MHYAHECEIQKQRTADGVCILCGDGMHRLRACPLFDPAVHVQKNPRSAPPDNTKRTTKYVVPCQSKILVPPPWE